MPERGYAPRVGRALVAMGLAWVLVGGPSGPAPSLAADPSPTPVPAGDPGAPVYVVTATGVVDNVMAGDY